MKTMPRSPFLFLLLCSALLAAAGCGGGKTETAATEASGLMVRARPAENRSFERRLKVQGSLEAKNTAQVAARTGGNLEQIWVDEGDTVTAGETPLFQVDPSRSQESLVIAEQDLKVAQASLAVAQASEEKTKAEARKAELDFKRYSRLHKEGKVTDNEFETREVAHDQSRAGLNVAAAQVDLAERQVKQAEARLAIARKNLEDTKVLSPITGVVSARRAEPGEEMSVGQVVLELEDLSLVEAVAYLPAQYYAEIVPGKTEFHLSISGKNAGSVPVTYRSPVINPTLRTFIIKGLADSTSGMAVPGSMADLTIVFETRENLSVPSGSILVRNQKPIVFIVRDGKAVATPVETGLQNDGCTEILSGLQSGDLVVTEGQTQLRDGTPVELL